MISFISNSTLLAAKRSRGHLGRNNALVLAISDFSFQTEATLQAPALDIEAWCTWQGMSSYFNGVGINGALQCTFNPCHSIIILRAFPIDLSAPLALPKLIDKVEHLVGHLSCLFCLLLVQMIVALVVRQMGCNGGHILHEHRSQL